MPTILSDECQNALFRWGQEMCRRAKMEDEVLWLPASKQRDEGWSRYVKSQYDLDRRLLRAFKRSYRSRTDDRNQNLANEFQQCVEKWRAETGHLSSIDRKAIHPSYQRIMAMGRPAIPLVLREMQQNGGHWFWALHFMTGASPVPEMASIEEARKAWLSWGREKGYL
jgi:hypothetical protein